jgi:hypothetical protein
MVNMTTIENYRRYLKEIRIAEEEYQALYPISKNDSLSIDGQRRAIELSLDKLNVRLGAAQSIIDILKKDTGLPRVAYACDEWLQEAGGA